MTRERAIWDLAAERLEAGHPFTYTARGQSMRPTIPDGSVVTVAPLQEKIRPGVVVLARRGDLVVLHRAIRQEGECWILKGDLNDATQTFHADEIFGKLVEITHQEKTRRYDTLRARLSDGFWLQISRRSPLLRRITHFF